MKALRGRWSRINRSKFARNFLSLLKANLFGQFLLLAAMPILTRFYTPAEFGVLAVFTSLLTTAESVCVWRFDKAMPNARSLGGAAALMASGGLVLLVVTALAGVAVYVVPGPLEHLQGYRTLGELGTLLPVAILLSGLRLLLQAWFVRTSEMRHPSRARIAHTVGYLLVCFAMVWLGQLGSGLVLATTIALVAACVVLVAGAGADLLSAVRRVSPKRWWTTSRAALGFTSEATVVGFVNMVSLALPILLLSQLYDAASLGLYALLYSMIIVPARTFTSALAMSFWARAAELARGARHARLRGLYLRISGVMFLGAVVVALGCLASPLFLVPLLGREWVGADDVLIRMIPLIVGVVVFSPTNHLVVLKLQLLQLVPDGSRIALMLVSYWLAREQSWPFETAVLAIACSSLVGHVGLFFSHFVAYRIRARRASLAGTR